MHPMSYHRPSDVKSGSPGIDVGDSGSRVSFVCGLGGDWAAGEHHEGECGFGAVESVGRRVISRTLLFSASVRPWLIPSRIEWRIAARWRRMVLARRMNEPRRSRGGFG